MFSWRFPCFRILVIWIDFIKNFKLKKMHFEILNSSSVNTQWSVTTTKSERSVKRNRKERGDRGGGGNASMKAKEKGKQTKKS